MTERKRRRPTPAYGIPPPFSPITGTHATLRVEGIFPYCALFQVAAADTYEDYVICRGFDPRIRKFIDYESGNADKPGISVGKPFGNRITSAYEVGQVFPAFLPTQGAAGRDGLAENYVPPSPTDVDWRVGQNSGTADPSATGGHPQDLSAAISELTDHNDIYVQWMLITGGGTEAKVLWGVAKTNWEDNGATCDSVDVNPCDDCDGTNPDAGTTHTVFIPKSAEQDPNVISGEAIGYELATDGTYCNVSDCLDDKIGTVKMWALASGNIAPGWAIMNGSANSIGNGGSGFDMTDKFVKGSTAAGTTGGFANHEHVVIVGVESHSLEATTHVHENTLTIYPHKVEELIHSHDIPVDTIKKEGTEVVEFYPVGFSASPCTKGDPKGGSSATGTSDCPTAAWGPLYHGYDFRNAEASIGKQYLDHETHTLYVSRESNEPPYRTLVFIERINNAA